MFITSSKISFGNRKNGVKKPDTFWFWLLLSGGLLMSSCRKSTGPEASLPPEKGLVDPELLKLRQRIQADETALSFYNKVAATYGTPLWEHAIVNKGAKSLLCYLPFSRPGHNSVSAVIAFGWGTGLEAKVLDPHRFPVTSGSEDARKVGRLIHLFDYSIWKQQSLGSQGIYYRTIKQQQVASNGQLRAAQYTVSICYEWSTCTGDGFGNCVGPVNYFSDCTTEVVWLGSYDYTFGGGGYLDYELPNYGTGGGTVGSSGPKTLPPPISPVEDLSAYLGCFDPTKPAKITVYADQPVAGYSDPVSVLGGIGHAFITIEQSNGTGTVKRSVGFYPQNRVNPLKRTSAVSKIGNDQSRRYDVSVSYTMTATGLNNALAAITYHHEIYDLSHYNCVDFVIDVAAAGGLTLPKTEGWWVFGSGANPGDFGEDLRKIPGASLKKGTAPMNQGSCN